MKKGYIWVSVVPGAGIALHATTKPESKEEAVEHMMERLFAHYAGLTAEQKEALRRILLANISEVGDYVTLFIPANKLDVVTVGDAEGQVRTAYRAPHVRPEDVPPPVEGAREEPPQPPPYLLN